MKPFFSPFLIVDKLIKFLLERTRLARLLPLFCITTHITVAQTQRLTLEDVVSIAQAQSVAAKQAVTTQRTNYWKYRSFLADYKPQLSLDGTLPGFTRSFVEVIQPDGTIAYQPVSLNNSALNLSLSQNIAMTGGSIFIQKEIKRFDNFLENQTLYNGVPFSIGLIQPLFRFNPMRWERRIEPLKYQESNQQLIESREEVSLNATMFYFDLLVAQVNLQIAEKNLMNNDTLYKIARKKLELGRISQNDLLQLELSVLTARKDLASAEQTAEVASLKLKTYIGYRNDSRVELALPNQIIPFTVDIRRAIDEAFANRAASIGFRRRLLEAEREVDKARKENGLNASMQASFGLSNRGARIGDVYVRPQDSEILEVRFSVPIMTWGRAQARTETAKANQQLTQQSVEQDKLTLEQQVFTQVTLLQMLQKQVKLTAEADQIAQNRYQIAQNRFILGDLSVTDLGIATQEKDRARRDAVVALRDYWQAYYTLRLLTLYNFETNQKIQ
ncbi:Outer membrane protein-like protein [Fibrisoma limi BUZ 3]|uniref:Outer membrane protein-like protein n=1 Tax=Fibrisoma limi BUZ 3 TaxID=1185876 RepID=I2GJ91_9BACT|nr:TolC family protein [Fibrisoma limi]CCH53966.1 Outer membrane protein-like protein [Fibrisoma limi BUZ 3]